ncbi:hypothetical protein AGMMS50256_11870 [Betaproteobacteria bacterium]|nr:hypothetical protein AGMMS50256_11870 [Betaproteobacteria bacterium]
MAKSRSKSFLYASVAQIRSDDKPFDDAKAGRPVGRRLNRIERVAISYHGQIDQRFDNGMLITFDSVEGAVLSACEMQYRCSVLPQVSRLKLSVRIGIHQGLLRQRTQDVADNTPQIAAQLAHLDDGILISQDIVNSLGGDLIPFTRPSSETVAGINVFSFDYREMSSETSSGVELFRPTLVHRPRTTPFLELRLGLKTIEISKDNPVITIGRDPTNDLALVEVHVSRNHCRIERTEDDILLTDSSVNGTIVVTEDKQEILIKNGSISLKGKGMIFLGRPFMGERRGGLHYELIRYESFS